MAAYQEVKAKLWTGYASGDSGWTNQINGNFLTIGALLQIGVKDRDLTVAPSSPVDGDMYIPATGATGVWATKDGQLAIYRANLSAWEFFVPQNGWLVVVLDESKLIARIGGAWTAGITL